MYEDVFLQECFQLIIICSNLINLLIALGILNVKILRLLGCMAVYFLYIDSSGRSFSG